MIYIPIGGNCGTALSIRKKLKLSEIALPFDYIRCNFACIIESISSNFEHFLPIIDSKDSSESYKHNYVDDYDHFISEDVKTYFLKNHSFWHHDFNDSNVKEAFHRRIERFNKLLLYPPENTEITFVRLIISKTIKEEIDQCQLFFDEIFKINDSLNYKLIFICNTNNNDFITYTKINDKCALIDSNNIDNIISFYDKFGFLQNDVVYDNEGFTTDSKQIIHNDTVNLCYMDIHIH